MKVALCLSGLMRTYRQCFIRLKKFFLDRYNCDIFISTWDHLDDTIPHIKLCPSDLETLYKDYLKAYKIENLNKRMKDGIVNHVEPKNQRKAYMFYKIFSCNQLKNSYENINFTKYDMVIRCRPDLLFTRNEIPPFPTEDELFVSKDKIIPLHTVYTPKHLNFGILSDQLAYGNSETMNLYSKVYNEMPNNNPNGPPEVILSSYLNSQKIKIVEYDYATWYILRLAHIKNK